jgi:hypothetical protein
MEFDWSQYIALSPHLANQEMVSYALDQIAATPEGRELIEKACRLHERYGSQPRIPIVPAWTESSRRSTQTEMNHAFGIRLNFYEIEHIRYRTPQGPQEFDLVQIMVHELYHMADGRAAENDRQFADSLALPAVQGPGLSESTRHRIFAETMRELLRTSESDGIIDKRLLHLSTNEALRNKVAMALGLRPEDFHFADISPQELAQAKLHAFPTRKDGTLETEADATAYTDAFMAKYFSIPARGKYSNQLEVSSEHPVWVPDFSCGGTWPKYQWENIVTDHGTFTQPTIHATSCEETLTPPTRGR